jgi:DNA mismatch endonuclease (patch repair protein)
VSLGGGQIVPYPEPGSAFATKIGKANRRTGTKPEEHLRRELHRLGLRYRKDKLLRAAGVRTHVDIVFGPAQLAVFVDGCFWHKCPEHFHMPKSNLAYWQPKLAANSERDRRVDAALASEGWTVVRLWEHVPVADAARRVIDELSRLDHPAALRARALLDG